MPWFRFIDDARVTLRFRNGACELNFADLGQENGWVWVAQKSGKSPTQIVLVRRENVLALRVALKSEGFDVPTGSPAERIMRAALKSGYAEDCPKTRGGDGNS